MKHTASRAPRAMSAFQKETVSSLAEIKTGVANIVSRLDRINGTVAEHQKALTEHAVTLASRDKACPLVGALQGDLERLTVQVSEHIAAGDAERKTDEKWHKKLQPFVLVLCGAGAALGLDHAVELLKFFGRGH